MDHDDADFTTTKEHARSKYHHGRLPLFANKTRGAHTCMMTVNHESRVCDAKGMWRPSRTSQNAHDLEIAHGSPATSSLSPRRHSGGSVSSEEGAHSARSPSPASDSPPRMHYEKPHHRHVSKKESLRASKELSHHRDRIQRREDLTAANGL